MVHASFGCAAITISEAPTANAAIIAPSIAVLASWIHSIARALAGGSDESFLPAVFGVVLLVAGIAQRLEVSGAIGAFLVGLALSGRAEERATELVAPLRDLFAAVFFVFFSFQVDPADLGAVIVPAVVLAIVTTATKFGAGWYAAGRIGVGRSGRMRAGATLVARGEFSIVIAALGVSLANGGELGAFVACYVLITALTGPILPKFADRLPAMRATSRVAAPPSTAN